MNVARSAAEVLSQHTTLVLECVDRMYLNVYVPLLQTAAGAAHFFREMRGVAWPSTVLMAPITERFVNASNTGATALYLATMVASNSTSRLMLRV